jgi:hypothetical protein
MKDARVNVEMRTKSRSLRLKEAVIASFWEPVPSLRARFSEFSPADWQKAMNWLDVSGLALYLFDRLRVLGLQDCLPSPILWRLKKNLADNSDRAESLFTEAVAVSQSLRRSNIAFALLKGVTLPAESVPDIALRHQVDLDILIRESDGPNAQECLHGFGYKLDAVSGKTWEFKAGRNGMSSLRNMYNVRPDRAIDLQLLAGAAEGTSQPGPDLLSRAQMRCIQGITLPALSPADIFVQQAVHLFKHMCNEYTRASWVLEFWRHISARRTDEEFWRNVESVASGQPRADLAIGAALLLTSLIFGPCAPEQLSQWTMDRLSPAVCLWIQMYGRHILLSDSPRSKLYLLLRSHLHPGSAAERSERRRLIFPIHMPQRITRAEAGEGLSSRLGRYRIQAQFAMIRLVFHTAEGLRLAFESIRWQRRLAEVTQ